MRSSVNTSVEIPVSVAVAAWTRMEYRVFGFITANWHGEWTYTINAQPVPA